jgi:hypothetical protein
MQPRPRPARWTDYKPGHARKVYHAIKSGAVHADTRSIATFLGQHWNTINNWRHRHVAFARAIMRGYEDRARLRGAILSCRRETIDLGERNDAAKTLQGTYPDARVKVEFDGHRHQMLARGGHLKTHMRRRWHERAPPPAHMLAELPASQRERYLRLAAKSPHVEAALGVIEGGALSNYAIARGLYIAESTLRNWRRQQPDLDAAIREAVDAYRERQREPEYERAWQRVAFQVERGLAALAMEDLRERGVISG